MSLTMVPQTHREHKAREIAADPHALYQVTPSLYLVRSQSQSSTYYEVSRLESAWTCTCPDHRRTALPCKHIQAIDVIRHARQDLQHWSERRHWTPQEAIAQIDTRLLAGNLDDRETLMLKVYRNAAALPTVAFALRYYWPDHSPETLLDPVYGPYQPESPDVDIRTPAHWSTWRPIDGTISTVREYIDAHGIQHGPIYTKESRRRGRWEGHFNLIMLAATA